MPSDEEWRLVGEAVTDYRENAKAEIARLQEQENELREENEYLRNKLQELEEVIRILHIRIEEVTEKWMEASRATTS